MAYLILKSAATPAAAPQTLVPSSSFLQLASYDPTNFALTLWFKSKYWVVHRYFFQLTWQQFQLVPSQGSFYATQIKGKYPAIVVHSPVKVTDLTQARKKFRHEVKNATDRY